MRVFSAMSGLMLFSGMACSAPSGGGESTGTQPNTASGLSFYDFTLPLLDGTLYDFTRLKGKKVLVVNVASECGYTPQYAELQELYQRYQDQGLVVLGFPTNDFGRQEPGSDQEIAAFCQKNYGVTFPVFSKISVKGEDSAPLYAWLTSKEQNGVMDAVVKWNFNKFLIDPDGTLKAWYPSRTSPLDPEILSWVQTRAP